MAYALYQWYQEQFKGTKIRLIVAKPSPKALKITEVACPLRVTATGATPARARTDA
ncbi:uncharacterized protein EKO05_0000444 [Ascochyta rabiei]|uniref:uncharacterized protein n=1 Tax=Didymella rabiei TaxID=5454 RepID=UPI0021FA0C3E|nr:uncharacterized protein EKO05_0000444 [Ascochyta rabiei]UPX09761.1 hypothetical protein EKO05_0000444 [Ascochyta rabiei]